METEKYLPDGTALLESDVVDTISNNVWRNESVFGNHGVGWGSRNTWATLVNSSNSELIFTTLNQTVNLALDLVTHGLNLLDGEHLALHPLTHVLLLLLDDVVSDGGASVGLWWGPGEVGVVGAPVEDVRLAAGPGLV